MGDPFAALADYIDARVRDAVTAALASHQCGQDGERLLSIAAACERAAVGRTTLYRWIAEGLPTVAAPGTTEGRDIRRIRQSDLDAWMRALPTRRAKGAQAAAAQTNVRQLVQERLARRGRAAKKRSAAR